MKQVLALIPTLTGREPYLKNAIRGYREHSEGYDLRISLVYDAPTCGVGWQRCIDQGLRDNPHVRYLHFGNDDIVVGENWLPPLVEAADLGFIPGSRLEPAGGHLGKFQADKPPMPPPGDPICSGGFFYSDLPANQPTEDWQEIDHTALPFCSISQWRLIGPMVAIHYGSDKWFAYRAKQNGMKIVARQKSVIYNFAAQYGRNKGDWGEVDIIDYDLNIALPRYLSGELPPHQMPAERLLPEGLRMARKWRKENVL